MDHLDDADILEPLAAHEDRAARPRVVVLIVIADRHVHAGSVHRMADGIAVEHEAGFGSGADAGQARVHDPVDTGPTPVLLNRAIERLDLDVVAAGPLVLLKHVGFKGGSDNAEHVVLFVDVNLGKAKDGACLSHQSQRCRSGGAGGDGGGVEGADDISIDLAVDDHPGRPLHDPATIALIGEDVEGGSLDLVVPLGERADILGQAVRAAGDAAIDATRHSLSATGAGHQEDGLVALDHGLGNDCAPKPGFAKLELGDSLAAVLLLESSVRH